MIRLPSALLRRRALRTETLALVASAWFALACNPSFWAAILHHGPDGLAGAAYAAGVFAFITGLQWLLLLLVLNRWTAKPLLALLFFTSAGTVYFMNTYSVYMDPDMVRNVLATDWHETRDLLSPWMLAYLAFWFVLPMLALSRVDIRRDGVAGSLRARAIAIVASLVLAFGALATVSQQLVPQVREQKGLRYLLTPGNYIYSLIKVSAADARTVAKPRVPVGEDAQPGPSWQPGRKPVALALVVGETARAANWGLSGYARQTTPALAALDVINFTDVTACGTNTETSLPCMFSAIGRRDYDEDRIRGSESLLHVVKRAGFDVLWRDNQSGCKGVCEGLPQETRKMLAVPSLCETDCLDEVLLTGLAQKIDATPGNQLIVLHQMGNHGPAYYRRYPPVLRRWTPTCDTTHLGNCSNEAIVNTYDNALLYTDHVLAQAIALLSARTSHDTALVYVSDHGESLGENGLYLHSIPFRIAPATQTHVPMILWSSPGFAAARGLDTACLAARRDQPLTHDNLFHTVLGLLDVRTRVYEQALDVTAGCRRDTIGPSAAP